MANLIATNHGEFAAAGDYYTGTTGDSTLVTSDYSAALGWSNGNGRALKLSNNVVTVWRQIGANLSELYWHQRINISATANSGLIVQFREGSATIHCELRWTSTGLLQALLNGSQIAIGTTVYSRGTAIDIQIHYIIHDTTGVFQVKVNGNTSMEINFSGDTRNGGSGITDRFYFSQISGTEQVYISDIVLNDTTGSRENSWTGAVRVVNDVPTSNGPSGVSSTPSAGSQYQNVDDAVPGGANGDTDYNEFSTPGQDWFQWPSSIYTGMTASSIHFVRTKYVARATDAGSHTGRSNAKRGGVVLNGATVALGSSYPLVPQEDLWLNDPNTGVAWAAFADIVASEFGVEMVA